MEQLIELVLTAIDEKKALNPVKLDLIDISPVADFFIICSGQTPVQVRAIADNVVDKAIASGLNRPAIEGHQEGRWILLDFGLLIVHVLVQAEREFYNLESLWRQSPKAKPENL